MLNRHKVKNTYVIGKNNQCWFTNVVADILKISFFDFYTSTKTYRLFAEISDR